MKRFYLMLAALFAVLGNLTAQTNEGQVSICPVIVNEDIPQEALRNLTNKLTRIIAMNGYGSLDEAERFVLVASVDVTSNDVVPTTPPRVSKKMDITMVIGDVVENKTFGSCCVSVAGIGTNDNKAFISALSRLNVSSRAIKDMFSESQEEISKFYSNSQLFLTKAHTYSMSGDFDKAIAYLMTVPPIDAGAYETCQKEIAAIYQQKIDKEGMALYNQANGIWQSTRSLAGAREVASVLAKIDPSSSAMANADALWRDISAKLRADELAAIEAAKRAHEERMKDKEIRAQNTKLLIGAAKAVGMAFGIFQPRVVVNNIVERWFL